MILIQKPVVNASMGSATKHLPVVTQVLLNAAPLQIFGAVVEFVTVNVVYVRAVLVKIMEGLRYNSVNFELSLPTIDRDVRAQIAMNGNRSADYSSGSAHSPIGAGFVSRVLWEWLPNLFHVGFPVVADKTYNDRKEL